MAPPNGCASLRQGRSTKQAPGGVQKGASSPRRCCAACTCVERQESPAHPRLRLRHHQQQRRQTCPHLQGRQLPCLRPPRPPGPLLQNDSRQPARSALSRDKPENRMSGRDCMAENRGRTLGLSGLQQGRRRQNGPLVLILVLERQELPDGSRLRAAHAHRQPVAAGGRIVSSGSGAQDSCHLAGPKRAQTGP